MDGFVDIYTIIFLVLAVVIFLRLRSVLGRRTGSERPPFDPYSRREAPRPAAGDDKVISLPRRPAEGTEPAAGGIATATEERIKTLAPEGSSLNAALRAIATADRSFDPDAFLTGAKAAYEMIVTAFAQGDRKALKNLLEKDVYEGFEKAISDREAAGNKIDFTFVGLPRIEISEAEFDKRNANLTIRFYAEVVSATRDKDGNLIEGNADQVTTIADEWTFARSPKSRDPNWKLVATSQLE